MPNLARLKTQLFRGGLWVAFGLAANLLATVGIIAILARLITPSELGAYFLAFSVVTVLGTLGQLGLNKTVVRVAATEVAKSQAGRARGVITGVFRLGIPIIAILVAGTWFVREELFLELLGSNHLFAGAALLCAWIGAFALRGLVAETFRSLYDFKWATIYGRLAVNTAVFLALCALWLTTAHSNYSVILELYVAIAAAVTLLAAVHLWTRVARLPAPTPAAHGDLLRNSLPVAASTASLMLLREGHIWVAGAYAGESETALFGTAIRLGTVIAMPLLLINNLLPPTTAALYSTGERAHLQTVVRSATTVASLIGFALIGFCLLPGPGLLALLFGEPYRAAYTALVLVCVGQAVNLAVGGAGNVMIMTGHVRPQMYITMVAASLSIATSVQLVDIFGAAGVATGFAVGLVCQNILMWGYCHRVLGLRTDMNLRDLRRISNVVRRESRAVLREHRRPAP